MEEGEEEMATGDGTDTTTEKGGEARDEECDDVRNCCATMLLLPRGGR